MENDTAEEEVPLEESKEPGEEPTGPAPVESPHSELSGPGAYVKMVEAFLMPDENGMVRKDKLVEFFQRTVGTVFNDDKATEVLNDLRCDGNNMIRLECFLKAFADKYCSEETLAGIVEVLGARPEALEDAWDWKGMLANIGLDLTDAELREALLAAKNLAEMLLSQQGAGSSDKDEEQKGQIFQAVQDNLHLMGLGEGGELKKENAEGPESH